MWTTNVKCRSNFELTKTLATQIVQYLVQAKNKENIEVMQQWPFVRGIYQWLVDSPHKGPVILWVCPCHDVSIEISQYPAHISKRISSPWPRVPVSDVADSPPLLPVCPLFLAPYQLQIWSEIGSHAALSESERIRYTSEWVIKFNGLSRTADSEDQVYKKNWLNIWVFNVIFLLWSQSWMLLKVGMELLQDFNQNPIAIASWWLLWRYKVTWPGSWNWVTWIDDLPEDDWEVYCVCCLKFHKNIQWKLPLIHVQWNLPNETREVLLHCININFIIYLAMTL